MEKVEIESQKLTNDVYKAGRQNIGIKKCFLCGKATSICNSHSIPRSILKNIAVEGMLLSGLYIDDHYGYKSKSGILNTWTFQIICRECDSKYFRHYEREKALLLSPTEPILSEIALKNGLFMLHKRLCDNSVQKILLSNHIDNSYDISPLFDKDDFSYVTRRARRYCDQQLTEKHQVVFYDVLSWKAPIAVQSAITIHHNVYDGIVNDTFEYSTLVRMQPIHLCVFPYATRTAILMFYDRWDSKNVAFEKQFLSLSHAKQIEWINYIIFKSIEHFAISPLVKECLDNEYLKRLFLERASDKDKDCVRPNQIPNFLLMKI